MEHGRNMFGGPSAYSSFYHATPSFAQPQPGQLVPCGTDTTPFPTVSDVFYSGGGGGGVAATGPHRVGGYYDSADFQPPYFPPPNPAGAQPVAPGLFAGHHPHHHRQVPAVSQQLQAPVVDQSMYWSPVNAAAVYTTPGHSAPDNVALQHVADQQKTYHALQQVGLYTNDKRFHRATHRHSAAYCYRRSVVAVCVSAGDELELC